MKQASGPEQAELHVVPSWPYDDALAWMAASQERVLAGGSMVIGAGEHDREVVTLGRHTPEDDLLSPSALQARGVLVRRVERGGGATAHGPGQIVCYPIVHLDRLGLDVPRLTDALEGAVIELLRELDIDAAAGGAERGVYVGDAKIASVGFRVVKGVVTHGLALNFDNDLALFGLIATCGRAGRTMTSVRRELGGRGRGRLEKNQRVELARTLARRVASRCVLQLPA